MNTIVVDGTERVGQRASRTRGITDINKINRSYPNRRRGAPATPAGKQGLHTRAVFYPRPKRNDEKPRPIPACRELKTDRPATRALIGRPFLEDRGARQVGTGLSRLLAFPPRVNPELPLRAAVLVPLLSLRPPPSALLVCVFRTLVLGATVTSDGRRLDLSSHP